MDIGFLNDGRQSFLRHAARLQKAREIAACPQPGNAQFDRSGPRLPITVAIAVALGKPQRILLAVAGAGRRAHFQRHQLLGGKADHLAQQISIRALLNKHTQVYHIIGHRWYPSGWS